MLNEPTVDGSERWMVLRTNKHDKHLAVDRWVRVAPVNALGDRRVTVWPGNGLGDLPGLSVVTAGSGVLDVGSGELARVDLVGVEDPGETSRSMVSICLLH